MTSVMAAKRGVVRGMVKGVAAVSLLLLATGGFFAWQHFAPVSAAAGWEYRVAHDDVPKAAGLAIDEQGNLLVTEELRNKKGAMRRIARDGQRSLVLDGLTKPDGLAAFMGGFAFSQETADAPVSLLKDGKVTTLFMANDGQGLKADGPLLYAIEDRKGDGRLMRYDARTETLEVLRDNLSESSPSKSAPATRCSTRSRSRAWCAS